MTQVNMTELVEYLYSHPETPILCSDEYKSIVTETIKFLVEQTVKGNKVVLQNLLSTKLGKVRKSGSTFGDGNSIEYRKLSFQLAREMEQYAKQFSETEIR